MRNSDLEEVLQPYEGENQSHREFRKEFKYLNAIYYLIASGKDLLQDHLRQQIAKGQEAATARGTDLGYALGIVTHPISASQIQSITVSKPDAEAMVEDFEGFIDLVAKHCLIAAHRAIVDYAFNLLLELDCRSLITLSPSTRTKLQERRLRPSELARQYEAMGEPIHKDESELKRLLVLGERRNLLEHNDGRATQKYVDLIADNGTSVGDPVQVTGREVGEAFAIIESVVTSLNRRVLNRFNLS